MLRLILLLCFALICVASQNTENNEACESQTTNHYNYYYSKDANPIAGPSVQPQADVLQGRPGKIGARGLKGDQGEQAEAGVPDNSVVELLRNELAQLTRRLNEIEEENQYKIENIQSQLNDTKHRLINVTEDCNDNVITSGTYYVKVNLRLNAVYCEVENNGGNWMVFQRRIDGSVDFYRNWTEYKQGFGNVDGNYWLGLDAIHAITSSGSYQLRVDLEDWEGNTAYALYRSFSVGDEASNYVLRVSGYSGNAGDSLAYHNNRQFTTKDRDNDAHHSNNCAVDHHGAWWYNRCHHSNLNGEYMRAENNPRSITWYQWKRSHYGMKRAVMKLRPN